MFASDVEGRIGMAAGSCVVRDQTSCPGDFPPLLPPRAGPGPHPCTAAGKHIGTKCRQGYRGEKKKVGSKK